MENQAPKRRKRRSGSAHEHRIGKVVGDRAPRAANDHEEQRDRDRAPEHERLTKRQRAERREHERHLRRVHRRVELGRRFRNQIDLRPVKRVDVVQRRRAAGSHERPHRIELEEVGPFDRPGDAPIAGARGERDRQADPEDDRGRDRVRSRPACGVRPQAHRARARLARVGLRAADAADYRCDLAVTIWIHARVPLPESPVASDSERGCARYRPCIHCLSAFKVTVAQRFRALFHIDVGDGLQPVARPA